jgi:hypothetical protein
MNYQKAIAVVILIAIVVCVVAIIALVVNTFICNNCLLGGGGQAQPQTVLPPNGLGVVPADIKDNRPRYNSLENATALFNEIPGLFKDDTGYYHIYSIRGENVDDTGKAAKWIFEMKTVAGSEIRVFERDTWTVIPWNLTKTKEIVTMDTIVSPSDLFNKSGPQILEMGRLSSAQTRSLELRGNVYTLTFKSASASTIMTFDAATGALIE